MVGPTSCGLKGRIGLATLVLCLAGVVPLAEAGAAQAQLSVTATSPTVVYDHNFPDPSVLVVGHIYYAYSTNSDGENLPVIESDGLTHWRAIGDAMSVLPLWATAGLVWSPSVTAAPDGGYQLFFSAYDQAEGVMCLGRAIASSPLGPFIDVGGKPFMCQLGAGGSIDPSVYRFEGTDYLVWKSDGEAGQPQTIMSQPMTADDAAVTGTPTVLLTADAGWEDRIVEGPAFFEVSGVLYLFFSANHWSSAQYAMGEATCASPLGPCPAGTVHQITISSRRATGAGGPTFFSAQGQTYMAFSAWTNGVVGNQTGHRAFFLMALRQRRGVATFAGADALTAPLSWTS
jgi:beta-xylosidase